MLRVIQSCRRGGSSMINLVFLLTFLILNWISRGSGSSISLPLKENGDITKVIPGYYENKQKKEYFNSTPSALRNLPVVSYHSSDPMCNVGFQLSWSSTVGSPVYGNPVIFPSGKIIRSSKRLMRLIITKLDNHNILIYRTQGYKGDIY